MDRMDQLAMAFRALAKTAEEFSNEFCRPGHFAEPWFGGCKGFNRITFPRRLMLLLTGPANDSRFMVESEGGAQCARALEWIQEHYMPLYAGVLAALPSVGAAAPIADQWFECARRYRRVRDAAELLVHITSANIILTNY